MLRRRGEERRAEVFIPLLPRAGRTSRTLFVLLVVRMLMEGLERRLSWREVEGFFSKRGSRHFS